MSVSEGREEFVRPLGGRHSREARVRARFRRMRMKFDIEFVLLVRLESRKLPRKHQLYETLTQGSRAKNPKMSSTICSARPSFLI